LTARVLSLPAGRLQPWRFDTCSPMASCGALPLATEPSFLLERRQSTLAVRTAWTRVARSSPAMTRRPRRCGPLTTSRRCCVPPGRRSPTSLRGRYLLRPMPTWPRPTVRSLRGSPAPEHPRSLPLHVLLALRCPGHSWRSAPSRHSRRIDFALDAPSGHEARRWPPVSDDPWVGATAWHTRC